MTLASPIAFAGAPLDLAENDRNDAQLAAYSKAGNARAILVHDGRILVSGTGELAYVHPQALAGKHLPDPGPLFLGRDQGVPVFAFSIAREEEGTGLGEDFKFEILRALALNMPAHPLALAGRAKSLFDWHREHRFCANCGQESWPENGGLMRKCRSCATDHFPRVNPVVIMLVCNGDRCLMGRNAKWPDGTYSCLAGFVSAGETLEEACKREVLEEVGLRVTNPVYKFCQPWPYPGQLMIGMFCETDETELTIDTREISEAVWFARKTVKDVLEGRDESFFCPPPFTIAHQLIKHWIKNEHPDAAVKDSTLPRNPGLNAQRKDQRRA